MLYLFACRKETDNPQGVEYTGILREYTRHHTGENEQHTRNTLENTLRKNAGEINIYTFIFIRVFNFYFSIKIMRELSILPIV